jgi:hypothetical protein
MRVHFDMRIESWIGNLEFVQVANGRLPTYFRLLALLYREVMDSGSSLTKYSSTAMTALLERWQASSIKKSLTEE